MEQMELECQAAPAVPSGVVEAFLQHLTEERIISAEQLLLAKQALRLWRQPKTGEQEQPIARHTDLQAQASPGRGVFSHAADNEEQLLQAIQAQQPDSPIAESAAKRRRCMPSSSQLYGEEGRAASPASIEPVPAAEFQPLELLARLPPQLLDHVMTLLAAEPGGSAVRRSCRWLRSAFDRCNTRLGMQSMDQLPDSMRGRLLDLVRRSPALNSLTLHGFQSAFVTWQEVLEAGGQQLLQRLERLSLRHDDVSDLGPVAACSRLQYLELDSCSQVRDLGPLQACTRLQHLGLQGCSELHDLSPLAACTGLQHLVLRGCYGVSDVSVASSCVGLQHLDLSGCCRLSDVAPLAACTRLRLLLLTLCNLVHDISPLASCTGLQHLSIFGLLLVSDITPLGACTGLQYLDVAVCRQVQDFSPLGACTGLQHLSLLGCLQVQDISFLAACTSLQDLNLTGCTGVHDLSPLKACTQLRKLNLKGLRHAWGDLRPAVHGLRITVGEANPADTDEEEEEEIEEWEDDE